MKNQELAFKKIRHKGKTYQSVDNVDIKDGKIILSFAFKHKGNCSLRKELLIDSNNRPVEVSKSNVDFATKTMNSIHDDIFCNTFDLDRYATYFPHSSFVKEVTLASDNHQLLRIKQILLLLNISRSTFWRWCETGFFPAGHSIGAGRIKAWRAATVYTWILFNTEAANYE